MISKMQMNTKLTILTYISSVFRLNTSKPLPFMQVL